MLLRNNLLCDLISQSIAWSNYKQPCRSGSSTEPSVINWSFKGRHNDLITVYLQGEKQPLFNWEQEEGKKKEQYANHNLKIFPHSPLSLIGYKKKKTFNSFYKDLNVIISIIL